MTIKFIKDVVFKDQKEDSVKIKKGKILTAKVLTNKDGKEEYEIKKKFTTCNNLQERCPEKKEWKCSCT